MIMQRAPNLQRQSRDRVLFFRVCVLVLGTYETHERKAFANGNCSIWHRFPPMLLALVEGEGA